MPLVGKPITNKATGIIALINVKQINEMLSNRAVSKSKNNGFTQDQHLEATGNIKQLYEDASLTLTRPDKKTTLGGQGLKSVKIFHCKTTVGSEKAVAKLTVKESFQHGHRVYSIELEELNKPAELENRTGTDSPAGSKGSTQKGNVSGARYAEEPSLENIAQTTSGGNIKYSIHANDNGNFHGAHVDNISFINANSKMPLTQFFWHESGHWLRANNPELWQQLREAVGITDAQRKAYVKENGRTDLTDDDAIDEEIIADALEDAAKRNKLFGNITKSGNLIERVISWLQDALRKFKEFLRNPQGKLTTEQFNRLSDEFGRMATSLVNQSGNKIFRYNRRTHTLEFADGRELKSVITGAEIKKSANEGELVLLEGYRTESGKSLNESDSREFIVDENGNRDMGVISKEIERRTNGIAKAVPVRLQVGIERSETEKGFGYIHMLKHIDEIQAKGFENIPSYVKHILKNFNQVYQATNEEGKPSSNRIILYCKGDVSKGFMPLDLELEKGNDNYYSVISAYPRRRANKRETLLVDTRPTNVSTVAATVPHERNINIENGVEASRDIVVSNVSKGNISQTTSGGKIKYSINANDNGEDSIINDAFSGNDITTDSDAAKLLHNRLNIKKQPREGAYFFV